MDKKPNISYQLTFEDVFKEDATVDTSTTADKLKKHNFEQDLEKKESGNVNTRKYLKNKVDMPKDLEEIIKQFYAGKV